LTQAAIGGASNMVSPKQQTAMLDQVKSVAECGLQLIYTAKEGAGNPKAMHAHAEINEAADSLRDALQDLTMSIEQIAAEAGVVTSLVEQLMKSIMKIDERYQVSHNESFVDFQTRMVNSAKEVAKTSQDMVAKSSTNVQELGALASKLTNHYSMLADDSRGAIICTSTSEVAHRIRTAVVSLGHAASELVKNAGSVQGSPHDSFCQRDLADAARAVSERVSLSRSNIYASFPNFVQNLVKSRTF
jgi:talin